MRPLPSNILMSCCALRRVQLLFVRALLLRVLVLSIDTAPPRSSMPIVVSLGLCGARLRRLIGAQRSGGTMRWYVRSLGLINVAACKGSYQQGVSNAVPFGLYSAE